MLENEHWRLESLVLDTWCLDTEDSREREARGQSQEKSESRSKSTRSSVLTARKKRSALVNQSVSHRPVSQSLSRPSEEDSTTRALSLPLAVPLKEDIDLYLRVKLSAKLYSDYCNKSSSSVCGVRVVIKSNK